MAAPAPSTIPTAVRMRGLSPRSRSARYPRPPHTAIPPISVETTAHPIPMPAHAPSPLEPAMGAEVYPGPLGHVIAAVSAGRRPFLGELVKDFTNWARGGRVQVRRRDTSAWTPARVAPVRKMMVANANTCGGIPTRVAPRTQVGNIVNGPWVNWLMTKSSMDSAKASRNPARIAGNSSGSVTLKNAVTGLAPRSIAAASSDRSSPAARARTVTATNATLNIDRDRNSVKPPRDSPSATKKDARAAPSTISGAEMLRKIAKSAPPRPRNRYRARARPSSVPSVVAASALSTPIVSEWRSAVVRSGSSNRRPYQSVVNPIHVVFTRGDVPNRPRVWLKLNRTMTRIGNEMYTMNATT